MNAGQMHELRAKLLQTREQLSEEASRKAEEARDSTVTDGTMDIGDLALATLLKETNLSQSENEAELLQMVEGALQQGNALTNKPALRPTVSRISTNSADYWITLDKKRHNKKCRYYQIFKGRPCGPDEGEPCPICGG